MQSESRPNYPLVFGERDKTYGNIGCKQRSADVRILTKITPPGNSQLKTKPNCSAVLKKSASYPG